MDAATAQKLYKEHEAGRPARLFTNIMNSIEKDAVKGYLKISCPNEFRPHIFTKLEALGYVVTPDNTNVFSDQIMIDWRNILDKKTNLATRLILGK